MPLYGDGMHVRDWLYGEDHCTAIDAVLRKGREGEAYNVGGTFSCPNKELMEFVFSLMDKPQSLIKYVTDRAGHDRRYALNCDKIKTELGWAPQKNFKAAMEETIDWYRDNEGWWKT